MHRGEYHAGDWFRWLNTISRDSARAVNTHKPGAKKKVFLGDLLWGRNSSRARKLIENLFTKHSHVDIPFCYHRREKTP